MGLAGDVELGKGDGSVGVEAAANGEVAGDVGLAAEEGIGADIECLTGRAEVAANIIELLEIFLGEGLDNGLLFGAGRLIALGPEVADSKPDGEQKRK